MQDLAQQISAECWRWYKTCISQDKGDREWDIMIESGRELVKKYEGDTLNYHLAEEMFLAFEAHAERLEKLQKEGDGK